MEDVASKRGMQSVRDMVLSVAVIEVVSISAVIVHGDNNPTLVRDSLLSVVMIILNGMVGVSLLIGAWRHREQHHNLQGANAYLGLRAGMTIAATYPAAVIGMAVLRLMKGSILEENIARTVGSIGESVAAGAIFTIPAFVMSGSWTSFDPAHAYWKSTALMTVGSVLGVLFVSLVRRVLVEDETLPFEIGRRLCRCGARAPRRGACPRPGGRHAPRHPRGAGRAAAGRRNR